MKKLTDKLQSSDLETRPGRTMLETFEDEVNQALNKARDDSGKEAQRSLDASNNVVRMVTAVSKGSFINISQVPLRLPLDTLMQTPRGFISAPVGHVRQGCAHDVRRLRGHFHCIFRALTV